MCVLSQDAIKQPINLFSHRSGGWESEIRMSAWSGSGEGCLPFFQMTASPSCPHVVETETDRQTEKAGRGCRLGVGPDRDGVWTREMNLQDPPSELLHSVPLIPWRLQRFGCKWLSLCRIESLALNSFKRFKKQNRDKVIIWSEAGV